MARRIPKKPTEAENTAPNRNATPREMAMKYVRAGEEASAESRRAGGGASEVREKTKAPPPLLPPACSRTPATGPCSRTVRVRAQVRHIVHACEGRGAGGGLNQ